MIGRINRNLTKKENYSGGPLRKGAVVYMCTQYTYGCISPGGVAVTFNAEGDYPFFEVPEDAVIWE